MFSFILDRFKRWYPENEAVDPPPESDQEGQEDQDVLLEDPCAAIVINFREDGDFTVAVDFFRTEEETANVSGLMLHMINSGYMAEHFISALDLWAEEKEEKKFILQLVRDWRGLYNENKDEEKMMVMRSKLAVDPSDVFGLKRMKEQG
jgi:hypothetical protein